ncbi:MAG: hypothetical protein ACUVQP_10440 [Bacteroidales bacterium]
MLATILPKPDQSILTPKSFNNNINEKVYTDEKDVILFWKTQMLYYIKTDRFFRSLLVKFDGLKFFFDALELEHKKANEKRSLNYKLDKVKEDQTIGVQICIKKVFNNG